jgi:hypothetical protein
LAVKKDKCKRSLIMELSEAKKIIENMKQKVQDFRGSL